MENVFLSCGTRPHFPLSSVLPTQQITRGISHGVQQVDWRVGKLYTECEKQAILFVVLGGLKWFRVVSSVSRFGRVFWGYSEAFRAV